MNIYKLSGEKLKSVNEKAFKLEKEIQKVTEDNLGPVFGLEMVKSEFTVGNFRFDTVAYDAELKSFVIIEYKRGTSYSVFDQGMNYLSLMLDNKADFVLEYNERSHNTLKRDDVDWTQTKVIFVSPSFNDYQKGAINFKNLPIELWEITRYEGDLVSYDPITPVGATESVANLTKEGGAVAKVTKEIVVYTEEQHLSICKPEILELYDELKTRIEGFDKVTMKPIKRYVAFKAGTNFVDIHPQKNALKIWLNMTKGSLDDSKGIMRDVSEIGHWGNGDYELQVKDNSDIDYLMSLIKQSYLKNKK